QPDMVVGLLDADGLAGEDLAEIDLAPLVADATAGGDGDGFVVEGVVELGQAIIGAWRGPVALGQTGHREGLMRALGVVDVDEVVEPALLLEEVRSGRFGGLQLEGEVHTLVTAILLRIARLDAFDGDAEPQPP